MTVYSAVQSGKMLCMRYDVMKPNIEKVLAVLRLDLEPSVRQSA